MREFLVCGVLVFSLILIGISFIPAFSYTEYYEESIPTFTKSPLVCAVEIEDLPHDSKMVMKITQNAIMEWKGQLQQTERYIKDQYIWDIGYTFVPSTKKNNFDYSKCDVVIRFRDQPSQEKCVTQAEGVTLCVKPQEPELNCDLLGETYYKTPIEIYIYTLNGCGSYISEKRMGTTILHEFGHALGLGHYVSDDENINSRWAHAETYAPSIMAIFSSDNVKYEQIRPLDIEKVLSLYGENGFLPDTEIIEPISKSQMVETKLPTFKNYMNNEFGFSINYPDTWFVDDSYIEPVSNPGVYGETHYPVDFYDTKDGWVSRFEIKYITNEQLASENQGSDYLDGLVSMLRNDCIISSFDNGGFTCTNHSIIDSKIVQIDGRQAYHIEESFTETYPDQTYFETIRILADIPNGKNVWTLDTSTTSDEYSKFASTIQAMVNSFHIIETAQNVVEKIPTDTTVWDIPESKMPAWVNNMTKWYIEGKISGDELNDAIQFLISEGIIIV